MTIRKMSEASQALKVCLNPKLIMHILLILPLSACTPGFEYDQSLTEFALNASRPGSSKIRRLSNFEYRRSLEDVLKNQFSRRPLPPSFDSYFRNATRVQSTLSALPSDTLSSKLGTDQLAVNLSPTRMSAYIEIAYAVGREIASTDMLLRKFAGECAVSDSSFSNEECKDQFISEFGALTFRSPPSLLETAELKSGIANWRSLIARILVHPRFLMHFERDGMKNRKTGVYQLTDYEVEARLASTLWKSSPDLAGLNAAKSGTLKTQAGTKAEIQRMLNSTRARESLWNFFYQWLGISRLPLNGYSSSPAHDQLIAPYTSAQLNNSFREAVIEDGKQLIEHLVWTENAKLEEIFRSRLVFTTNPLVAQVYGISARPNNSAPPSIDQSGNFSGILSRPFITQQKPSTDGDINHIQRGILVLTNLLGKDLGQPANFADQQLAQVNIPLGSSTRFETTAKTMVGACISCHTLINPAGYAFANFDTVGRFVTTEKRFRSSSGTSPVASNPVDATTSIFLNNKLYSVTGINSLTDAIFESGAIYEGFAKYYFTYVFGRNAVSAADRKLISTLISNLKTQSLRNALESLASEPEFKQAQTADL